MPRARIIAAVEPDDVPEGGQGADVVKTGGVDQLESEGAATRCCTSISVAWLALPIGLSSSSGRAAFVWKPEERASLHLLLLLHRQPEMGCNTSGLEASRPAGRKQPSEAHKVLA